MAQASWRRAFVAVLGVSWIILGGCGTGRNTEMKDSWIARVPEERLGDVRRAQAFKRQAADEVMRADVAVGDAERALAIARRNAQAAKIRKDAEKAQLEAAQVTGQRSRIWEAEAQFQRADVALEAARAEVVWRKQTVDAWKAQKELQRRELQVADAELNHARYLALKANGDVRAQQLTEGDFLAALSSARRQAREARQDADATVQKAQQARAQWERLRGEAQGYGGSGPDRR